MTDPEKLRIVLPHWMEHTGEHAGEFRSWARKVQPVQEQLTAAAELLERANERLQEALQRLGGALDHPRD
jgi:hypothetical protein